MDEDEIARMAAEGGTGTPPVEQTAPVIDYAKLYADAQAQQAIMQQQLNQALANQQQMITQQQVTHQQPVHTQPVVDPFASFDDKTAAALRAVTDSMQQNFQKELAATKQNFQQMQINNNIQQIQHANPAIAKRAQEIYAGHAAKGLPLIPQDALRFAIGEAVELGTYKVGTGTNSAGQPPTVLPGGTRQPVQTARPANFNALPLKKQAEILGAAPGFHDEEF